jgi:hypothetical protein
MEKVAATVIPFRNTYPEAAKALEKVGKAVVRLGQPARIGAGPTGHTLQELERSEAIGHVCESIHFFPTDYQSLLSFCYGITA